MKVVRGFKGVRYNPEFVGELDNVITPPYDIISPELRDTLANLSEYNFVHIDLPKEKEGQNKYKYAGDLYSIWKKKGVLLKDNSPKTYWLVQSFKDSRGYFRERLALLTLVKLPVDEFDQPHIFPHEKTFEKPVEDRKLLFEATNSELSPVFLLYSDPEHRLEEIFKSEMNKGNAYRLTYTVNTVDGVTNNFIVSDWNEALESLFIDKNFYIADGHHRFKMALSNLREKVKSGEISNADDEPYFYLFSAIVAIEDPGLMIYSPHRILKKFPNGFSENDIMSLIKEIFDINYLGEYSIDRLLAMLNSSVTNVTTYGLVTKRGATYLITLKREIIEKMLKNGTNSKIQQVCVYPLHRFLFESIELKSNTKLELAYEPDIEKCIKWLKENKAEMVFLLGQISPSVVKECAEAGEFMPQKSTYFFPKIPSGLVIYELSKDSL